MAVLAMEKIQVLGMKKDLPKILNLLQKKGIMQVEEINEEADFELEEIHKEEHDIDYVVANTDFAIKLLTPHAKKRPIWAGKPTLTAESALGTAQSGFDYRNIIKECQKTEEINNADQNTLNALETEEALLQNWKGLSFKLDTPRETDHVRIHIGEVPLAEYEPLKAALHDLSPLTSIEKVNDVNALILCVIAIAKTKVDEGKQLLTKHKFQEVELPVHPITVTERLKQITEEKATLAQKLETHQKTLIKLAKNLENLQIVHDVFAWQQEDQRTREKLKGTTYSFVITGWVAKLDLKKLDEALHGIAKTVLIHPIKPEEDEEAPILLHNKRVSWPFESVTRLYGFPLANEVDPTPFLATFFIVFFALCLTDAGYGLVLFLLMFLMLRFFNLPKESTGLIRLLMWGGVITMISGYFFGGYFGITPDQAPAFMVEAGKFKGQLINATEGNGPLTFLMLALALGVIQILFGKLVDGWWKIKQKQYLDALLDSFLWIYFLCAIIAFGFAKTGTLIPAEYGELTKWLVLGGVAAMVLTQGRKQKGILGKFGLGVLSLYGLVGYLGDILSYSRIMALGLGTGIIAFAMNTIAGLAYELIPYVGIIFAVIVIILGHVMNLVLSALGAFIHSARLQFVEFFGKFMEGGGTGFKPFKRTCKYIVIT